MREREAGWKEYEEKVCGKAAEKLLSDNYKLFIIISSSLSSKTS